MILVFDDSNVEDLKDFIFDDGIVWVKVKLFGIYDFKGKWIIYDLYYGDSLDFEIMFCYIYWCCEGFLYIFIEKWFI